MASLGDLFVHIRNGANIKQGLDNTGYPITRIETISNRVVDRSKMGYAGITDLGKYSDYVLNDGDILMSHINSETHLGKTALYEKQNAEIIIHGMNLLSLRPKTNLITSKYAFYYFSSQAFLKQIPNITKKSVNQASFTVSALKELYFPITTIEEQNQITEEIDRVINLISLRKQQLLKLDELVKSRFIELFGAYSAKDCTRKIGDYADVLGGYAFKSNLFCIDEIPVIRISNINDGVVTLDYSICFGKEFWELNKRFRAEQMDIMMAMSGATTGKVGLFTDNQPALINQRVACIRAIPNKACPEFLFVATQLEWMYDLIQETSAGCAQPNISGKQIENMPVPDVSYEDQRRFAVFVRQTDKSKLTVQKSLEKLEILKKALMQKYFG